MEFHSVERWRDRRVDNNRGWGVVTERVIVPAYSVVAGVPAKILRSTTEKDRVLIKSSCENYLQKLKSMGKFE